MTGRQLYETALAALCSRPGEDPAWDAAAPGWLNLTLMDCLNEENALRRFYGEPPLDSAPRVTSLEQEFPCHSRLQQAAACGLIFLMFQAAGDLERQEVYRQKFLQAKKAALLTRSEERRDVYGG